MGLETSHDCWSGSYTGFNLFREALARAAGIPLDCMEGFYEANALDGPPHHQPSRQLQDTLRWLPLSWDIFKRDAITVLLDHSDSEGSIPWIVCNHLADRLWELADVLAESADDESFAEPAMQFARGCRRAAENHEDIEFR